MSLPATMATAIKATLDTVTGVGLTYDHVPLPAKSESWEVFVGTFTTTIGGARTVRAWTVGWLGRTPKEVRRGMGSQKVLQEHRFLIRGYAAIGPTSEAMFRDLADTVANALDANVGLGGTVLEHDPVSVDMPERGMALADVGVHYAEITLVARVEVTL